MLNIITCNISSVEYVFTNKENRPRFNKNDKPEKYSSVFVIKSLGFYSNSKCVCKLLYCVI